MSSLALVSVVSMVPVLYNWDVPGFHFQNTVLIYGSPDLECFRAHTAKMLLLPHRGLRTDPASGPTLGEQPVQAHCAHPSDLVQCIMTTILNS